MRPQHTAAQQQRRCSRCRATKPPGDFYRNPASVCKACHNAASRLGGEIRRAALTRLVAAHQAEYRRLLADERARRTAAREPVQDLGGEAA
jgi:recombinational DNA repair protein (RecF pathway)